MLARPLPLKAGRGRGCGADAAHYLRFSVSQEPVLEKGHGRLKVMSDAKDIQ